LLWRIINSQLSLSISYTTPSFKEVSSRHILGVRGREEQKEVRCTKTFWWTRPASVA